MTKFSRPPWTPKQVRSLNSYQQAGVMHPFTCANDDHEGGGRILIATPTGWQCPDCPYRQDWAHTWMADDRWRRMGPRDFGAALSD